MTTKNRPLTASLHTVTAVTRVAVMLAARDPSWRAFPEQLAAGALDVLGYDAEACVMRTGRPNSELLAKCLASVQKALAAGGAA
jgi:hypothetical protein